MLIAVTEALQVRMIEISYGLAAAVFVAAFGHAVTAGVLATDAPARRLVAVDDETACTLARHLVCGAQALAALVIALAVHRALAAPPPLTVATDMLYALFIGAILLHLLLSTRGAGGRAAGKPVPIVPWLHALGWLILAAIVIALLAGYARFAAFVAIRLVSLVVVLGALYLLLVLASALFVEQLAADAPRHQLVGTDVAVTPIRIGFASLYICLGLILAALFLAIGPW
jgi:potassium efflux system protein